MDDDVIGLPKFICIGAQKAATSWLWVMLRQHPSIWMPPFKEIHYFDYKFIEENRKWIPVHIRNGVKDVLKWHVESEKVDLFFFKYLVNIALNNKYDEDWYKSCFQRKAARNKLIGDITPEYCQLPVEGIKYMTDYLGKNVKIIYIIRDPLDRALSQLKMNINRHSSDSRIEDIVKQFAKNTVIIERGDYKSYIPRWEKIIPKNQIHFIPYGIIKNNPTIALQDLEKFLAVPQFRGYTDTNKRVHKTAQVNIPDYISKYLSNQLIEQYEFLYSRFSKEFTNNIK